MPKMAGLRRIANPAGSAKEVGAFFALNPTVSSSAAPLHSDQLFQRNHARASACSEHKSQDARVLREGAYETRE